MAGGLNTRFLRSDPAAASGAFDFLVTNDAGNVTPAIAGSAISVGANEILFANAAGNGFRASSNLNYVDGSQLNVTGNVRVSSAGNPAFITVDTTNNVSAYFRSQDTFAMIGTFTDHDFVIERNSVTAITVGTAATTFSNPLLANQIGLDTGVTLQTWSDIYNPIETNHGSIFISNDNYGSGVVGLASDLYQNASYNWVYRNTGPAVGILILEGGQLQYQTAVGGTAGATATMANVFRIGVDGNIQLGGVVVGSNAFGATTAAVGAVRIQDVVTPPSGTLPSGGLLYVSGTELHFHDDAGADYVLNTGSGASVSGTPVDNQVAVFTNATTIEGDANFTWDGDILSVNDGRVLIRNATASTTEPAFAVGFATTTNGRIISYEAGGVERMYLQGNTIASSLAYTIDAGFTLSWTIGSTTPLYISESGARIPTFERTVSAATGNEVLYQFNGVANKATSGNYSGIVLDVTETAAPGTDNLLLDLQIGSSSYFSVGPQRGLVIPSNADPDTNLAAAIDGSISYDSTDDQIRAQIASSWKRLLTEDDLGFPAPIRVEINGSLSTGQIAAIPLSDNYTGAVISEVRISVEALPGTQDILVDIRKNGTTVSDSIFTSNAPLDISTTESGSNGLYQVGCNTSGATVGTTTVTIDGAVDDVAPDDVIYIVVTQVGSAPTGSNLTVQVIF